MESDQQKVISCLRQLGSATDSEIADYWDELDPINSKRFRPRRSELTKEGRVIEVAKRRCKVSDNFVSVWALDDEGEKLEKNCLGQREMNTIIKKLKCANTFQRCKIVNVCNKLNEGGYCE